MMKRETLFKNKRKSQSLFLSLIFILFTRLLNNVANVLVNNQKVLLMFLDNWSILIHEDALIELDLINRYLITMDILKKIIYLQKLEIIYLLKYIFKLFIIIFFFSIESISNFIRVYFRKTHQQQRELVENAFRTNVEDQSL